MFSVIRDLTIILFIILATVYGIYNFVTERFVIHYKGREILGNTVKPMDYRYSFTITDPDGRQLGRSKVYGTAGQTATGTLFKNAEDGNIYELTENGNIQIYKESK